MLSKKELRSGANSDSYLRSGGRVGDDGAAEPTSAAAVYEFSLDEMIPADYLLRRINVFAAAVLADLHEQLKTYYSDIGRPSIDPELMIRMLLVGYCYGIRHERRLCQEVALHLAYRWFCKLDLDDKVPHHSTFSVNRLGRFRESEILRHIFERVVATSMAAGLVKGEGFAVDASVMEANASRYYGKATDELDWSDAQRQSTHPTSAVLSEAWTARRGTNPPSPA
jgi:transposase